ncbi:MAG: 30S ribosomal protein S3 [Candidatus Syntropharchaeia archaeon]
MAIEKKFVKEGIKKSQMYEFLVKQLAKTGFGGMNINKTPMGTQITIYAERPGMIIGRGGKIIRKLTKEIEENYDFENPQIDVQQVENPELNAQMMASRLADALERGWYFRRAGYTILQQIMDAGALGCEITISGKLTGLRARSEKFLAGYIKHCGKPAEEIVDKGFAYAKKKQGVLGVKVKIVKPDVVIPDNFNIVEKDKEDGNEHTED